MQSEKDSPSFFHPFPRGQIAVVGQDAGRFLQNLVTNDISLLETLPQLHACLLTPQGKYLHDFWITKDGNSYLLACEGGARAEDLARRLSLYKLRAQIDISLEPNTAHPLPVSFEEWDTARIRAGQPDGSRDAEIGVSTLAELNLDETSVSYTKGCYVGQEIVARMKNRNLGKTHLVPLEFSGALPQWGQAVTLNGETIGSMRSSCGQIGLVLMNREMEEKLKQRKAAHNDPVRLLG
jgi:folate-binding protein YgfZ